MEKSLLDNEDSEAGVVGKEHSAKITTVEIAQRVDKINSQEELVGLQAQYQLAAEEELKILEQQYQDVSTSIDTSIEEIQNIITLIENTKKTDQKNYIDSLKAQKEASCKLLSKLASERADLYIKINPSESQEIEKNIFFQKLEYIINYYPPDLLSENKTPISSATEMGSLYMNVLGSGNDSQEIDTTD